VKERATNVGRRLLEHCAGVLGAALEETEHKQALRRSAILDANNDLPSPLSSPTHKFDGAHLFAGHEGAVVPGAPSRGVAPQFSSASRQELEELEARLAAAEERAREQEAELENAQMAAAAELEDVRTAAAEELADVRAADASALARARERGGELERRVTELERELESSIRGGEDAAELEERVRTLERELSDAERKAERAQTEAEDAAAAWDFEKASWASERALFGQERERWAELSATLESEREMWELEREELTAQAKDQVADAANGLRGLIQRFDIPLFSRESGLGVLVDAVERYLEKHNAQESEQLLAAEAEKRNAMTQELEAAKAEIQALQSQSSVRVSALFSYFVPKTNHLDGPTLRIGQSLFVIYAYGTQAILADQLCEGCGRLRRDSAATLGHVTITRGSRGTTKQCCSTLSCGERANVPQPTRPRQP
jgi:hypothetical protein